jgi:hypothetical protein
MTCMDKAKPFCIPKREVWEAYKQVKANQGAAGVDGETIEDFERDLKRNLYRIWNRMSSGSYFPPPVRRVDIPKGDTGGTRPLGVPTVSDRIAQSNDTWSRSWNLSFTRIPTDIGPGNQRMTPWPRRASDAGAGTGCWTSTSKVSSMKSISDAGGAPTHRLHMGASVSRAVAQGTREQEPWWTGKEEVRRGQLSVPCWRIFFFIMRLIVGWTGSFRTSRSNATPMTPSAIVGARRRRLNCIRR